jgi:hypothetical protein
MTGSFALQFVFQTSTRRTNLQQLRSFRTIPSRCAKPKATAVKKTAVSAKAPSGIPRMARVPTPVAERLTKSEFIAKKLWDNGVRTVYEAPKLSRRVLLSWVVGLSFLTYSFNIVRSRHWDASKLKGMSNLQAQLVAGGHRLGAIFASLVGGYSILRYCGFIKSIRLVQSRYGYINLRVHIKRRTPWSQTHYTVPPGDVILPREWRRTLTSAQLQADSESSRQLTRLLGRPFTFLKSWLLMDGVVSPVHVRDQGRLLGTGMLDMRGSFNVSDVEFESIVKENT